MTNVWIAVVLVAVVACSATLAAGAGAASAGIAPEQLHIALRGQVNQQNGVLCVTIHVSTTSHHTGSLTRRIMTWLCPGTLPTLLRHRWFSMVPPVARTLTRLQGQACRITR